MHQLYRNESIYLLDAWVWFPQPDEQGRQPEEKDPTSTTRILCLHGYHGSAAILRRQMSPVAAGLPADVELVYVDAPSLASGDFGWWHEGFRGWERTSDWMIELVGLQRYDGEPGAAVVLGHGTATGVEAMDLQMRADALPRLGFTVVLVTQPYRLDGKPQHGDEVSLDRAWTAVWPSVSGRGVPLVSGGRSAGSQVACRTARALGADAVLALAYPLLGPGSSEELLRTGRPTLVVQGERVRDAVVDLLNRRLVLRSPR